MNPALTHPLLYAVGKQDPYPALSKLINAKVMQVPAGYWLISGYQECRQVIMDQTNFSVKCRNKIAPHLLGMDPPEHLLARKRAATLFTRPTIEHLSSFSREVSARICAIVKNKRIDFVETVAFSLPAQTIGHFLGVKQNEQLQFNRWVQFLMYAPVSMETGLLSFSRFEKVNEEIDNFFLHKIRLFKKCTDDDDCPPLYRWFEAQTMEDSLLEDEFLRLVRTLMFAGIATVSCFISNTLRALQRDPELWHRIKEEPSFLPSVLEESLRYDAPVPHSEQISQREVEVGGVVIPPNQSVIPFFALANRDPSIFEHPHVFDPLRKDRGKHLSFGLGAHACMGANLARMMASDLFTILSDEFSNFQFDVEIDQIEWLATSYLRGPKVLAVRFET